MKIYQTILDSSIWGEEHATRLVWITLLAMADFNGRVEASVGGLARRAQVTEAECKAALEILSSPDPDDKSKVDEGRRIRPVERGWVVVSHSYYRDLRTESQIKTALRVQKHRHNKPVTGNEGNTKKRSVRTDKDPDRDKEEEITPLPIGSSPSPGDDITKSDLDSFQPDPKQLESAQRSAQDAPGRVASPESTLAPPVAPRRATKARRRPSTECPGDLKPLDRQFEKCRELGVSCFELFEAFKTFHASKGNLFVDWSLAFDTWIRNQKQFNQGRNAAPQPKQPNGGAWKPRVERPNQ